MIRVTAGILPEYRFGEPQRASGGGCAPCIPAPAPGVARRAGRLPAPDGGLVPALSALLRPRLNLFPHPPAPLPRWGRGRESELFLPGAAPPAPLRLHRQVCWSNLRFPLPSGIQEMVPLPLYPKILAFCREGGSQGERVEMELPVAMRRRRLRWFSPPGAGQSRQRRDKLPSRYRKPPGTLCRFRRRRRGAGDFPEAVPRGFRSRGAGGEAPGKINLKSPPSPGGGRGSGGWG